MANLVPNNLALSVINTGDVAQSAPLRNNYAAIQSAVNELISCLGGGTAGQLLVAVDGTNVQWLTLGRLATGQRSTGNVTSTGTTFAAGADLLASPLNFSADGTSSYLVIVSSPFWQNSGTNQNQLLLNLDGANAGIMLVQTTTATGGIPSTCYARTLITPSAGSHTVNVRLIVTAGTGTVAANAGGAGVNGPLVVTVEKL